MENILLYYFIFQRIIIRIWGTTVFDQAGEITQELVKAFSTKPCIGILGENPLANDDNILRCELPVPRYISKKCNVWSADTYLEDNGNHLDAAVCPTCQNIAPENEVFNWSQGTGDTDVGSEIKEEFHSDLTVKTDIDVMEEYDFELGNSAVNHNDEEFSDLEVHEGNDINNDTAQLLKSNGSAKGQKKHVPRKITEEHAVENQKAPKTDYHYTGPIAVTEDQVTRELEIIPVENAVPNLEYRGNLHPFHDNKNWMAVLFPQTNDATCPFCQHKYQSSIYMMLHLKLTHAFDWYQCPECKIWRNQPGDIIYHCNEVHAGVKLKLICPCCKMLIDSEKLEEHSPSCFLLKYEKKKSSLQIAVKDEALINTHDVKANTDNEDQSLEEELQKPTIKVDSKERIGKQCKICQKWLANERMVKEHAKRVHTGRRPFMCLFCGKSFSADTDRNNHRRKIHSDSWAAEKKKRDWLRNNKGKDSSEYKMQCHLCEEGRLTIEELRSHWDEKHPGKTDLASLAIVRQNRKQTEPKSEKLIGVEQHCVCESCGKNFTTEKALRVHVFRSHPEIFKCKSGEVHCCDICGMSISSKHNLINHQLRVHKIPFKNRKIHVPKKLSLLCDICGTSFTSTYGLNNHKAEHLNDANKPKNCTYCDKKFPTYPRMCSHRRIAHAEQYAIDKEKLLKQEGSKYLGIEHPDKKNYRKNTSCGTCGKNLCSRQQLNLHMKALHGAGLPGYASRK